MPISKRKTNHMGKNTEIVRRHAVASTVSPGRYSNAGTVRRATTDDSWDKCFQTFEKHGTDPKTVKVSFHLLLDSTWTDRKAVRAPTSSLPGSSRHTPQTWPRLATSTTYHRSHSWDTLWRISTSTFMKTSKNVLFSGLPHKLQNFSAKLFESGLTDGHSICRGRKSNNFE